MLQIIGVDYILLLLEIILGHVKCISNYFTPNGQLDYTSPQFPYIKLIQISLVYQFLAQTFLSTFISYF
jgi:hypothetical protein